jgi:solute:Na+ symporter, SSS family
VRVGVGANAIALIAFAIVPVSLGMVARVLHPSLASPDQALPTLLAVDLPPFVGALTLAAVFSAEVSAADAVLFMLSTSLSQDLYRRFLSPNADDARILAVARGSAIVAGAAGLAMALVLPTVVDALKIFYSLLTVALFVPVVAGLLWQRPGTTAALASIAAGTPLTLAIHIATAGRGVHGWPPVALGLLISATAFAAMSIRRPA